MKHRSLRRWLAAFCLAVAAFLCVVAPSAPPAKAFGPGTNQGAITAANAAGSSGPMTAGSSVAVGLSQGPTLVSVQIGGTWSGTLHLYQSVDGTNRVQIPDAQVINVSSGASGIPSGATGIWQAVIGGGSTVHVGASAWTSGTANLTVVTGPSSTAPSVSQTVALTQQLDYAGTSNVVYVGEAPVGTATSSAAWRITKYTYTSGNVTAITYAGTGAFNQVWDNRASLTYG